MARKIITKLKMSEISGVDKPAQPGATTRLMKRAEPLPQPEPRENTMYKTLAELLAAIQKAQTTPAELTVAELENIHKSATALNADSHLPATGPLAKAVTVDPARVAALETQLAKADKIGKLAPVARTYFDGLDEAGQTAFLAKSAEAQLVDVDKANATDPVVYTCLDGSEIKKSHGDVVLALAKRADDADRRSIALEKSNTETLLAKRVTDEIPALVGTDAVKKALLRAVDTIGDPTLKADVLKTLIAANAAVAGAFTRRGSGGEPIVKNANPDAALEDLAKAYAKDNKVPFHTAYDAVLQTPEGQDLYNQSIAA